MPQQLKFASIPQKRLLAGITSASSTFYVNNILSFDGLTDVTSADLGTTYHFVAFRNDTGTILELMQIDPTTISAGPITILKRGLSFYGDLTTETTDLKLDWPSNTIVMFGTDVPQVFQWLKEYIDTASIAGAVPMTTTVSGIGRLNKAADDAAIPYVVGANDVVSYAADSVGTDSYAITPSPAITAYATGQMFRFKAGTANTGACTLNVNGLGAKTIKKDVSTDLATGDILANQIVTVIYDGTNMQLQSQESGVAKTTDLTSAVAFKAYTVGALDNALVKTYFNIQLPFILWTGEVNNDGATTFDNWVRNNSTSVIITSVGASADFRDASAGVTFLYMNDIFNIGNSNALSWNDTNIVIMDWWAKLPATDVDDINMGFGDTGGGGGGWVVSYDSTAENRCVVAYDGTDGKIYATIAKSGVGVTNTEITGITVTNWNNYRIELDLSNNALFYVNGVLKATLSGANLQTSSQGLTIGFGSKNDCLFQVTAPTLSLQMNP